MNIANTNNGGLDLGNGLTNAQIVTANLTGGAVNCFNVYSDFGCSGNVTAALNLSGGAILNDAGTFIANQTAGTGNTFVLNISGSGTAFNGSTGTAALCYTAGTGTINQTAGTVLLPGTFYIAGGGGTTGIVTGVYNLGNGSTGSGVLQAGTVTFASSNASSSAILNFNGGTLQGQREQLRICHRVDRGESARRGRDDQHAVLYRHAGPTAIKRHRGDRTVD